MITVSMVWLLSFVASVVGVNLFTVENALSSENANIHVTGRSRRDVASGRMAEYYDLTLGFGDGRDVRARLILQDVVGDLNRYDEQGRPLPALDKNGYKGEWAAYASDDLDGVFIVHRRSRNHSSLSINEIPRIKRMEHPVVPGLGGTTTCASDTLKFFKEYTIPLRDANGPDHFVLITGFGADHDVVGAPGRDVDYVMSPVKLDKYYGPEYRKFLSYSKKSQTQVANHLKVLSDNNRNCLDRKPPYPRLKVTRLGSSMTLQQQCMLMAGPGAKFVPGNDKNRCQAGLKCQVGEQGDLKYFAPYEWTPCGGSKICIKGKCVPKIRGKRHAE